MRCLDQIVSEWKQDILQFLTTEHTPISVQGAIFLGLKAWLNERDISTELNELSMITPNVLKLYRTRHK